MIKLAVRMTYAFLLMTLITSQIALASVDGLFSDFFYSPQISSLHCGRNISLFVKKLAEEGHDIDKISILSITANYHRWSFGRVVAVNARWGTLKNGNNHQNWDFHVIAVIDQKVYDLSFNESPLVLPFNDYLDSMFIPKSPFAINGETFRVGEDGPFYSADYAREELQHYQVKIMKSDKNGKFTTISENQKLVDFLK